MKKWLCVGLVYSLAMLAMPGCADGGDENSDDDVIEEVLRDGPKLEPQCGGTICGCCSCTDQWECRDGRWYHTLCYACEQGYGCNAPVRTNYPC